MQSEYFYNIGDIISDEKGSIKILEQFRDNKNQKCYKYKCLKCEYIGTNLENKIAYRKIRCSVCCINPKIIIVGKNNLTAKHP